MGKTKRSGNTCCVPGCSVNGDLSKIKFYRFPIRSHNLGKRAKWIKAVKRVNDDGSSWEPSSRSRLCSQHFVGGEKSEHPHSPAYLPTIFPEKYYGKQKNNETSQLKALNRFARTMRRRQNQNSLDNTKPESRFCEIATQVDFYESEVDSTHINMFSTVRENGTTCEAETQANISFKKSTKKLNSSEKYS